MAFNVSTPQATPSAFKPPRSVEFTFKAVTTGGSTNLDIVYSAPAGEPFTLDGGMDMTSNHPIDENEVVISRTFTVAGSFGAWQVEISCTDSDGLTKTLTAGITLQ